MISQKRLIKQKNYEFKRSMVMIVCLWIVLALTAARPLNLQMPDVDILNLPTDTIFENVFNGDRYKHTFEDSSFEFGSEVYERDQPIKKDIVEDFEGDWGRLKQAFRVSDRCKLDRTHVTFDKISETPAIKKGIDAYLYDTSETVYLLSQNTVILYRTAIHDQDPVLQEKQRLTIDPSLNLSSQQAVFFNLFGRIYLTDGIHLLLLQHNRTTASTEILATNFKGVLLQQDAQFIKIIPLDQHNFLSLTTRSARKYRLTDSLNVEDGGDDLPKSVNNQIESLVDGVADEKSLYILDQGKLIVVDKANTTSSRVYELGLGVCERLEKVADTLEIICEYHRKKFVAELIFKDQELYLNRFYSQIDKIQDIDFYNGKGFFIGQHEVLILSHSVNRNALIGMKQEHMKTYASFGIHSFDVMVRYSTSQIAILVGISHERAMLIKMQQYPVTLQCDFTDAGISTKTVLVELNTSFCEDADWSKWKSEHQNEQIYCRRRIPFVFNIGLALPSKSQNLIILGMVVLALSLMMIIIGVAARWGTKMRVLMRHMSMQLARKQSENSTSKHIVNSHMNMLQSMNLQE